MNLLTTATSQLMNVMILLMTEMIHLMILLMTEMNLQNVQQLGEHSVVLVVLHYKIHEQELL